jgi:hypothetical protein
MEFVFLDGNTGADLELSRPSYEIAYHDGRYAYSALPSTAPKVQPGSARSCGLLFMTDLYIQALPRTDRSTLLALVNDDDKWPRSAGTQLRPRTDILAQEVAAAPQPIRKRRSTDLLAQAEAAAPRPIRKRRGTDLLAQAEAAAPRPIHKRRKRAA